MRYRTVRLRRLRMAMFGWIVSFILVAYAWSMNLIDLGLSQIGILAVVILAMLAAMHIAIRRGWSERLRDPSLTLPHILVSIFVILYVLAHAGEARTILLMLFFIAIIFGVFQLRREEYILVAVVGIFGFGLVNIDEIMHSEAGTERSLLVLELGVFAAVMFWFAFIGSYVASLRRKLSERHRELEIASEHLRHLADHDELTGLPNRRRLLAQLEKVRASSIQLGLGFSVAVIDLDHFKRVNDKHGHQVGDEVLAEFARRADHILRGADRLERIDDSLSDIGRFGGEEFLAILPATDTEGARLAAERLRQDIEQHPFETSDGPIRCTISIGVARHHGDEPVHHTVGRADEALYRAKSQGRNRVMAAEAP